MAVPTYVASGTKNSGTTSPRTPAYPAGLAADDRLFLQVFVRATDDNATCATPSGWTYEFEDPANGYGTQFIFSKKATGSESGTLSVSYTGTGNAPCAIARIYAIRGVTTAARWYEPGDSTVTIGGTNVPMPTVVTTGTDRLALAFFAGARDITITAATGETGGDWIEPVAEVTVGSGTGATLQLQTANLASAGILSGGAATYNQEAFGHIVRGMALIATGGTLSCGAAIYHHTIETTASASVSGATPLMAAAGDIVFAHVVAKDAAAAVTSFANVPTDSEGGSPWTLVHQNVSGSGPALRAAVFKRAAGTSAIKIDTVSFTASSTPDSLSASIHTVAAGDINDLKVNSATSTSGDPSATLSIAPASTSTVMAFFGGTPTGSPGTTPTGFTQIANDTVAPSHQRTAVYYDAVSPVQSAAFSTTNAQSVAILVEIPLLAVGPPPTVTGTGARTLASLAGVATGTFGVDISDPTYITGSSTTAASHTSASYTPSPNAMVLVLGSARKATTGAPAAIGITSTALSFTKVVEDATTATAPTAGMALFQAQAGLTPAAMTVSVSSTGAERMAINIVEIEANYSTAITNFDTGINDIGDPAATLPNAPNANSVVLGAALFVPSDSTVAHPFGTELTDISGNAFIARNICFKNKAGPSSASWTTGGGSSVAILVEIGTAGTTASVTGTAARTLNPLTGAATGKHGVVGSAARTLAALAGSGAGIHAQPINGTAARTLAKLDGFASGIHAVGGTGARTLVPLAGAATGTHIPTIVSGTGARTLNPLAGAATGVRGVVATAARILNPLTGVATGAASIVIGVGAGIIKPLADPGGPWSDGTLFDDGTGWDGGTIAIGVHGVRATATSTLAALTASATGAHGVVATASCTLNPLTGAATAVHGVVGSAARTLAPLTGTAIGAQAAAGTAARTLNPIVGAATAVFGLAAGTAARTLAPLVGVATAGHGVAGSAARTLIALSGAAAGSHGQPITGTGTATLEKLDGFATGIHAVSGVGARILAPLAGAAIAGHGVVGPAARILAPLAGAAVGIHAVGGTAARTLVPLVGAATGTHGLVIGTAAATLTPVAGVSFGAHGVQAFFGSSARTLAPLVGAASGIHAISGTGVRSLAPLAGVATGGHGVAGTAGQTLAPLAGVATAVHGFTTGTAARTLAPLAGVGIAVHGVVATASRTLAPLSGAAVGFHGAPVTGTAARTLAPLAGAAAGVVGVAGTAARTLAALAGAATAKHGVHGTAARTLVIPVGAAVGTHTVTVVGVGSGLVAPLHGAALGVRGVVGTADRTVTLLVGHAIGFIGTETFGEAAIELLPLSGLALGHFEAPIAVIRYRECQLSGFQLTKDNARYDPDRRAYLLEDVLDDPEPAPRRPPTVVRLR